MRTAGCRRSRSRVEAFGAELRDKYGVALVDSIVEVLTRSDGIMILSVDGYAHLPQAKAVFGSGKPVFIDKPLGGNLAEAIQIRPAGAGIAQAATELFELSLRR